MRTLNSARVAWKNTNKEVWKPYSRNPGHTQEVGRDADAGADKPMTALAFSGWKFRKFLQIFTVSQARLSQQKLWLRFKLQHQFAHLGREGCPM